MQLRRLQIEQGESPDERKRIERQRLDRAAGAGRGAALPAPDPARLFRRGVASPAATAISARRASSGSTAPSRRRRRCRPSCAPASASAWSIWSPSCWASAPRTSLKFNHDRLPTFGVGAGRKAGEWRSIFRQLSAIGLIAQDLMEHGRWWVTDEGWRVLKGEATHRAAQGSCVGAAGKGSRRDRSARRRPRPSWATPTRRCSTR